jgi:hypothetical protein
MGRQSNKWPPEGIEINETCTKCVNDCKQPKETRIVFCKNFSAGEIKKTKKKKKNG